MLRIIPFVFILCLFGLTLIPVSLVFAEDSPEFVACQKIKPNGDFNLMKQKKNCFRNVARSQQDQGGEVAQLNAKMAELETEKQDLQMVQGVIKYEILELEIVCPETNYKDARRTRGTQVLISDVCRIVPR